MATENADESGATEPTTNLGITALLVYGFIFGIGLILVFDTIHNLTTLYEGYVSAPGVRWFRVLVTSGIGSTCLLTGLSVVFQ